MVKGSASQSKPYGSSLLFPIPKFITFPLQEPVKTPINGRKPPCFGRCALHLQEMGSAWSRDVGQDARLGIPAAGNACIADVTENSYKLRKTSLFWEVSSGVMERVWGQPGNREFLPHGIPHCPQPGQSWVIRAVPKEQIKAAPNSSPTFLGYLSQPGSSWITEFVLMLEKDLGHPCWSWSSTGNFCQESPPGSCPVAEQGLCSGFLVADPSSCPSCEG